MTIDPQIDSLFNRLSSHWEKMDFDSIRAEWNIEAPPLYLAEEAPGFATSWSDLEAYWQATRDTISSITVTYELLHEKAVTPDVKLVAFNLVWLAHMTTDEDVGGTNRGMACLQRIDQTYKFAGYIEAPLAPIFYVKELYKEFAARRMETIGR